MDHYLKTEFKVVEAKAVADGLVSLEAWLNEQGREGWYLTAADLGVLYLARHVEPF